MSVVRAKTSRRKLLSRGKQTEVNRLFWESVEARNAVKKAEKAVLEAADGWDRVSVVLGSGAIPRYRQAVERLQNAVVELRHRQETLADINKARAKI